MVLDTNATEVASSSDGASVRYQRAGKEELLRARHCVLATPASVAHELGRDLRSETRSALDQVTYGTVC